MNTVTHSFRQPALASLAALLLIVLPTCAQAALLLTVAQVGGNVVISGSGTLNTTDLTFMRTVAAGGVAYSLIPYFADACAGSGATDLYSGVSGPEAFGAFIDTNPTSTTGGFAGSYGSVNDLFAPGGYVSGTPIIDSATFDDATFSSLGFTPGTYTYTWGTGLNADSLTVTSVVPEPSTWALAGASVGLLGVVLRRRQRGGGRLSLSAHSLPHGTADSFVQGEDC